MSKDAIRGWFALIVVFLFGFAVSEYLSIETKETELLNLQAEEKRLRIELLKKELGDS